MSEPVEVKSMTMFEAERPLKDGVTYLVRRDYEFAKLEPGFFTSTFVASWGTFADGERPEKYTAIYDIPAAPADPTSKK